MAFDENKSFPVSWEELHRNSKALAWRLLEMGPLPESLN
jgi:xanthine phosphoribosyltransferase